MIIFDRGVQIMYIPTHVADTAGADITLSPENETGFIERMGLSGKVALCRYWRRGQPGELRTTANGEWTPLANLYLHQSVSEERVAEVLAQIDADAARLAQMAAIMGAGQPGGGL